MVSDDVSAARYAGEVSGRRVITGWPSSHYLSAAGLNILLSLPSSAPVPAGTSSRIWEIKAPAVRLLVTRTIPSWYRHRSRLLVNCPTQERSAKVPVLTYAEGLCRRGIESGPWT